VRRITSTNQRIDPRSASAKPVVDSGAQSFKMLGLDAPSSRRNALLCFGIAGVFDNTENQS
jgi:hypothetical protein